LAADVSVVAGCAAGAVWAPAGALAAHRLTRREIQEATVAEAEVAVGRKLVPGQWWLTTAGAKTTAIPQELVLEL